MEKTTRSERCWGGAAGILATACFVTESVLLRHSPSTNQATSDVGGQFERGRAILIRP